jgi:predicted CopG family antitoxin
MAFKTLAIKESTCRKITRFKDADESYSDLLDREFDKKILTLSDLAEWADEAARTGRNPLKQRKNSPHRPRK